MLLQILRQHSDREHALTLAELGDLLAEQGISSERKSLYRDLDALTAAGFPVVRVRSRSIRYYLDHWSLSPEELELLLYQIRLSPSIPRKRKRELELRLCQMAPKSLGGERFDLILPVPDTAVSERVYSTVEFLCNAIRSRLQIRFFYRGPILKERFRRNSAAPQTVSPYRVIWNGGYWLVAGDASGDFSFYRVDRMESVCRTSIPARDQYEIGGDLDFDLQQYIMGYFSSSAEPEHLLLQVSEAFLSEAERYFPGNAVAEPASGGGYLFSCDAPVDDSLYGWLLLHSGDITLLYPTDAAEHFRTVMRTIASQYRADFAESGINYEENGKTVDKQ